MGATYNSIPPDVDDEEVVRSILALCESSLLRLELEYEQSLENRWTKDDITKRLLFGNVDEVYYELTPQGGRILERQRNFSWCKVVASNFGCFPGYPKKVMSHAISKPRLEAYLEWGANKDHIISIIKESICITRVSPCPITYWKTLPSGYRAIYRRTR